MKKKVNMLKKLIGGLGFGKAAILKAHDAARKDDREKEVSPALTHPRKTAQKMTENSSLTPRNNVMAPKSPMASSPKLTVRGALGVVSQGKLAARVLAARQRRSIKVSSPRGEGKKLSIFDGLAASGVAGPTKVVGHRASFLDDRWTAEHGGEDGTAHHYTIDELHAMHRSERLQLQMQRNTEILLRSESNLRRQTHLFGDLSEEDREKIMTAHRLERWLTLVQVGRFAAGMARHLRIVKYLREKGSGKASWEKKEKDDSYSEEEEERWIVNVNLREIVLVKKAITKILKHARKYLAATYEIRKRIMMKRMARLMKGR